MTAPRPEYRHGRIVWAYLRTAKGKHQEHPAVILTADSDIVQPGQFDPRSGGDNVVVVAGISTKYRNYAQPYVELPYVDSPKGHPVTELRKDSAVIVGWYQAVFIPDDIIAFSGDVPAAQMQALNQKIFRNYVEAVGDQYINAVEAMAELRRSLVEREFPG